MLKKSALKTIAVILLLTLPFVMGGIFYPERLLRLSSALLAHTLFWRVFRLSFILGFLVLWPFAIKVWSQKRHWPQARAEFWRTQQWRLAGWLLLFELLMDENILMNLF